MQALNWWNYTLYYAKQGIKSKLLVQQPIFLTVFVTARCGLQCGHCFYREELLQGDIHKELQLWEYKKFTQYCPPFPKLIITGGEPFLRPDLSEIVEIFYHNSSKSRQITIPTSGQYPEKTLNLVQRTLDSCPDLILEIQLSIDGIHEQHDTIRGKGQFSKLLETYHLLRPIQDQNPRLRIRFNFTFSAQSQDHFVDTHKFVTETLKNPHFDMVLIRRTSADPKFFRKIDLQKYKQATAFLQAQERKKVSSIRENGILSTLLAERAQVEREIIAEHYAGKQVLRNCQAGTLTAILSEEGELRPCEILDTSFGNIRDHGYRLDALWNNYYAMQHRKDIANTCFCTFETCVRTTMVFQPKWLWKTITQAPIFKKMSQ